MKLRINGYARHGKDTVADIIADMYGLVKPDASRVIARWLVTTRLPKDWYTYKDGSSMPMDEQVEACYLDRINHRTGWYNFVSDAGPETLCMEVMRQGDIYVGERRRESFELTKPLFDFSIWVTSEKRGLPPEPVSSCDLTQEGHDYIIENDGDMEDLLEKVKCFMEWAFDELLTKRTETSFENDQEAIMILKSRGYRISPTFHIWHPKNILSCSTVVREAMTYLQKEWDYGHYLSPDEYKDHGVSNGKN
jgi:hypothetical protein